MRTTGCDRLGKEMRVSSTTVNLSHRQAQAMVRDAILSTPLVLYDANGREVKLSEDDRRIAKVRTEIHKLIDDGFAKLSPEDLTQASKIEAELRRVLSPKKSDKYVFDVSKGELAITVFDGDKWNGVSQWMP
jgi:hypothetical protein